MTDRGHLEAMTARPTHPGEVLREVVLPAIGISCSQAAARAGIGRQDFDALLAGDLRVDDAVAGGLGELCGNGPDLWLRMQATVDAWDAMHSDAVIAYNGVGARVSFGGGGGLTLDRDPGEDDAAYEARQELFSHLFDGPAAEASSTNGGPADGRTDRRRFVEENGPSDEANALMDGIVGSGRRGPMNAFRGASRTRRP